MKPKTTNKLISQRILQGGVGDRTNQSDVDQNQLMVGIEVQKQHTNNKDIATQIAMDHLSQHGDYYTKLIKAGLVDEPSALTLARKLGLLQPKKKDKQSAAEPEQQTKPEKQPKKKDKQNQSVYKNITRKELLSDIAVLIVMQMKQDHHTLKQSWSNVMSMYKTHGIVKSEKQMILNNIKRVLIEKIQNGNQRILENKKEISQSTPVRSNNSVLIDIGSTVKIVRAYQTVNKKYLGKIGQVVEISQDFPKQIGVRFVGQKQGVHSFSVDQLKIINN